MTCRIEDGIVYRHEYNAENRLTKIEEYSGTCTTGSEIQQWVFTYDGDGTRIKQVHTDTQGSTTDVFLFGGLLTVGDAAGTAVETRAYLLGGQRIAIKEGTALKYLVTDHLGSTIAMLDSAGTLIAGTEQRYYPFGAPRLTASSPAFTYTGQRDHTSDFGLMDYNARFYSPRLGRFTQPDTIIPGQTSQNYNRYSYVVNNPIMLTDPTGHDYCGDLYDPACMETDTEKFDLAEVTYDLLDDFRLMDKLIDESDIVFTGTDENDWDEDEKIDVMRGVVTVRDKLAEELDTSTEDAWAQVFGSSFQLDKSDGSCTSGCWGELQSDHYLKVFTNFSSSSAYYSEGNVKDWVIHEIGHNFDRMLTNKYGWLYSPSSDNGWFYGSTTLEVDYGLRNARSEMGNVNRQSGGSNASHEVFADVFVGWTNGNLGGDLGGWFDKKMNSWLP